ncbi:MAG: HAMP domain-containing sensor histidine kinase, partial [Pseudomonadota bacterium]
RLAALGGALAKVSHDLRNILASTQLFTERLELSQDPMTARVAPKLVRAVDRAIRLCEQTLRDGRADEPPPAVNEVDLHALADEVAAAIGADARAEAGAPPDPGRLVFENRVPPGFAVTADPDQLFRAVLNLSRNAGEAILSSSAGAGVVAVEARETSGAWVIDVVDDGPGVPEAAQRALFQLYKGSTSRGGSGLGLAISRELARNHGGDLVLAESTAAGARFRITLPRGSSLAGGGGGPAEPARRREVAGE